MSPISYFTGASGLSIGNPRRSMNRILVEVNLSPIRSQTRKRLDSCSKSGLRWIKSKPTDTMKVIESTKKNQVSFKEIIFVTFRENDRHPCSRTK